MFKWIVGTVATIFLVATPIVCILGILNVLTETQTRQLVAICLASTLIFGWIAAVAWNEQDNNEDIDD